MNNLAIKIEGLYKYYQMSETGKGFEGIKQRVSSKKKEICALQDINLNVEKGEILGIVGPNGSGKSTLLKVISEVTPPSKGRIEVYGKVASVLEIGIGFNPDLTGTENVYLNAGLHGIRRSELTKKLPQIIEMFGFPEFMDTPVKYYSSGMQMRLAFAVIINIEADIYLFDEILTVGDIKFQKKAVEEIKKLKKRGATVLVVTHSPNLILDMFNKLIIMNKGEIVFHGNPYDGVKTYANMTQPSGEEPEDQETEIYGKKINEKKNTSNKSKSLFFDAQYLRVSNRKNNNKNIVFNEDIVVELRFSLKNSNPLNVGILVKDQQQTPLTSVFNTYYAPITKTTYHSEIIFNAGSFKPTKYLFDILVIEDKKLAVLYPECLSIKIERNGESHKENNDSSLGHIDLKPVVKTKKI